MKHTERILRRPEVQARYGASRSTLYLRVKEGRFPQPISLGPRMVGWPEGEVAAVIAALVRGDSDEAIRELVHQLEDARRFVR